MLDKHFFPSSLTYTDSPVVCQERLTENESLLVPLQEFCWRKLNLVNNKEEFQQQFNHMNAIKRTCQVIFFLT